MIGFNGKYLSAAAIGDMRITAMSQGDKWLITPWLADATKAAILSAFGAEEGAGVIQATNVYLNGIAITDKTKAKQIGDWLNTYVVEDAKIMYSLVPLGKARLAKTNGTAWLNTGLINAKGFLVDFDIVFDQVNGDVNRTIGTFKNSQRSWVVITNGYCNLGISSDMFDKTYLLDTTSLYHFNLSTISGNAYLNVNGTRVLTRTNTYNPGSIEIWVGKVNGLSDVQKGQYGLITFYDVDNPSVEIAKFVPFVRNNTMGFLDLLTGNFKTNQGSGNFTEVLRNISYTPSTQTP